MAESGKSGRMYGGQSSAEREARRRQSLLDAAIDTLIAGKKLTVRGICEKTGLTSRYFYENFHSTDDLAEAAYDTCVSTIAATVTSAFAAAEQVPQQVENAMHALVSQLEADSRAGHILFSYRIDNQLVTRKRQESTAFFAEITAATASTSVVSAIDVGNAAQFVVGGVTQLLSTWLNARYDRASGPGAGDDGGLDGPTVANTATTMITALATQLAVQFDEGSSEDSRSSTSTPE